MVLTIVAFTAGCNVTECPNEEAAKKTATENNPGFIIAPVVYSSVSENGINHIARSESGAWNKMPAYNIAYAFPDATGNNIPDELKSK